MYAVLNKVSKFAASKIIFSANVSGCSIRIYPGESPVDRFSAAAGFLILLVIRLRGSMLGLFKSIQEEELVILVLESDFNEEFDLGDCVVLAVPSNITVDDLKRRIQGAIGVTNDRIVLLYHGDVLSGSKVLIPSDAFELAGIVDEDTNLFRARICMQLTADPVVHINPEEADADRYSAGVEDNGPRLTKTKHKKKAKVKEQFDLSKELTQIQCERFVDVLAKESYDNEV